MSLETIFRTIVLVTAALIVLLVLLQQRGASLGAGSGDASELYTKRRGLDKSLFNTTVICAVLFVCSILGLLLIPS